MIFLSYLRHFDFGIIHFFAGVPCFALHRLPGNCRPFRTFFKTSELQKLRILRFLISEILNFYNSGAALGIGAASFWSETGTRFGDGNEVTELVEVSRSDSVARRKHGEQRYSGKPDGFAGTPKEGI